MNPIITKLEKELKKHRKPENLIDAQHFHKEKLVNRWVLKAAVVRKISKELFREVKGKPIDEIFELCEQILASGHNFFAFDWAYRYRSEFRSKDFKRFEQWLKKYVHNWGSCDHICCNPFGHFIYKYQEHIPKTRKWASSKNQWLRRASAVVLIPSVTRTLPFEIVTGTTDLLLTDSDDMVQKGYGWLLKVTSRRFPQEVFDYVVTNRQVMPRTAFRYAIEKLPPSMRKEAMRK